MSKKTSIPRGKYYAPNKSGTIGLAVKLNPKAQARLDKLNRKLKVGGTKSLWSFLERLVDNGTTYVNIPTPKNWKCKRKGCRTRIKHTHSTYTCLLKNQND